MENERIALNPNDGPTLEAVLNSFEAYVTELTSGIVQSTAEGEARTLAESTAITLTRQLEKVHGFLRESHEKLGTTQKVDFQQFLRVQDGVALAQKGVDTCKVMFKKGGLGKKFVKWLVKWFQEIKKIIKAILKFLCSLFGWSLPIWFDDLTLLLDELVNLLASIFGESLGLDVRMLDKELSSMEIAYLGELRALELLQQAQRRSFSHDEEA